MVQVQPASTTTTAATTTTTIPFNLFSKTILKWRSYVTQSGVPLLLLLLLLCFWLTVCCLVCLSSSNGSFRYCFPLYWRHDRDRAYSHAAHTIRTKHKTSGCFRVVGINSHFNRIWPETRIFTFIYSTYKAIFGANSLWVIGWVDREQEHHLHRCNEKQINARQYNIII